ncbi:XRE family transcriptional regulator [Gallibacterium anatis]|uniref:XRE family transcriptional regulator n=1 Tax=Gallibacterium anatis TaxID=750 RepID=UPI00266F5996|nr:S24 family peptidase [Gallibacterium anatis]WKS98336.1 helix-turn-helix domain-containing protein [Gallibacterium anatis]
MESLSERLSLAMKIAGKTQAELGSDVGVSQTAIGKILSGKTLNPKYILDLAKALNVSVNWLANGKGEMELDPKNIHNVATSDDVQGMDLDNYIVIDMYDVKLSAGTGNLAWFANDEDPVLLRKSWFKRNNINPDSCKAMYVKGSSMVPDLENGDTVIIDTDDVDIEDGEIYAVSYKQRLFIKRVIRTDNGIQLISSAKGYDPIEIDEITESPDTFKVLGKKVWRGG